MTAASAYPHRSRNLSFASLDLVRTIEGIVAEARNTAGHCVVAAPTGSWIVCEEIPLPELEPMKSSGANWMIGLDGVRLATMHRVKGLEFDHVLS